MKIALALFACIAIVSAEVYFRETFDSTFHEKHCFSNSINADSWESRWIKSSNKVSEGTQGDFRLTAGKYYADAEEDQGSSRKILETAF
jgi:calreticulin